MMQPMSQILLDARFKDSDRICLLLYVANKKIICGQTDVTLRRHLSVTISSIQPDYCLCRSTPASWCWCWPCPPRALTTVSTTAKTEEDAP